MPSSRSRCTRRAATKENRAEVGDLRIAYLGSGSKGNSALIEAGRTSVMLDCGFSTKETLRRLDHFLNAVELSIAEVLETSSR